MNKNFLKLIETEQIDALFMQVFNQKILPDSGDSSYTEVLTEEEETALVNKLLCVSEPAADKWLEFTKQYLSHYSLCNKAVGILLDNVNQQRAVELLLDYISRYSYNEQQGMRICNIALNGNILPEICQLVKALCANGRIFSADINSLLERIEMRFKEAGCTEFSELSNAYKKAIEDYRNQKI